METKEFNSLFVKVPIQVPSTVTEFDDNAKRAGACLGEAINNVVYRSVLNDFRDLLIHGREASKPGETPVVEAVDGLETYTGISRKTEKKTVGKKEVEVYSETESEYIKRVCAAKAWDLDNPTELQQFATEIAKHLVFDASATVAAPKGPKKLPEDYLQAAQRILTKGNQAKYARFGITWTGETDKDAITLGWKIREEVLAEQRAKTAKYD
jgi:hypothetical protein